MSDKIHRFIFDSLGIRGQMLQLEESVQEMLSNHQYPPVINELVQQAGAVSILLTTTLKFEGRLSIQLQTPGKMKLLIVQANNSLGYRGMAQFDEEADYSTLSFKGLTENGNLSITIEPKNGQRYQGFIELNKNSFAECIEDYFNLSEQLETRIWLHSNEKKVTGLMLQALPDMPTKDGFSHLSCLADTLGSEEALSNDIPVLLTRLFHQEDTRDLLVQDVNFQCVCSKEKMLESIGLLSQTEIEELLAEENTIDVKCEFCANEYKFDEIEIKSSQAIKGNKTEH